jgi:hypothetical protein
MILGILILESFDPKEKKKKSPQMPVKGALKCVLESVCRSTPPRAVLKRMIHS